MNRATEFDSAHSPIEDSGSLVDAGDIFRAGRAHLEALNRLAETNPLTSEEIAAVFTQIDLIYQEASLLKPSDPAFASYRVLAHLFRPEGIEAMVMARANPRIIRAIRLRRATAYFQRLRELECDCAGRMEIAARTASEAGEWILFGRIDRRRLKLLVCILRLKLAGRAYSLGFRVNVAPILERVKLLVESS
jgi:hypothetical protein